MKLNKKQKQYIIFGIIILGIALIYLNLNLPLAIIGYGSQSVEQTKQDYWNGQLILKAPYFGSLTSGSKITIDGFTPSGNGWNICGDNDGKVTVSNSYTIGSDLVLISSTSGSKGCSGNYLEAEITLPKGTLTSSCDLSISNPPPMEGEQYFL